MSNLLFQSKFNLTHNHENSHKIIATIDAKKSVVTSDRDSLHHSFTILLRLSTIQQPHQFLLANHPALLFESPLQPRHILHTPQNIIVFFFFHIHQQETVAWNITSHEPQHLLARHSRQRNARRRSTHLRLPHNSAG